MKVIFAEESWEDYLYWQQTDKKMLDRINKLTRHIARDPCHGPGKPEPLKHKFRGYWSRRINAGHRLIYKVTENGILVAKCRFHYD